MIRPALLLRTLTLLGSAGTRLALEDPQGFLSKAKERVRTADNRFLAGLPVSLLPDLPTGSSLARELIDRGELSAGIEAIEGVAGQASRAERHLGRITRQRLSQLRERPVPGIKAVAAAEARVLYVLTNSQPFTNSGYTVRTQSVLQAATEAGVPVHAVTRLAYPVLVGKIPSSLIQEVKGISYERLLPWVYPRSLRSRDDLAVKMIVERARRFNATILHTTTDFKNALVTSHAAAELGIPWVYEVRGELEGTWLSRRPAEQQEEAALSEFYRLAREQETRCCQAASAVVALSEVSKQKLVDRGVAASKIQVIPNAIEEQEVGRDYSRAELRTELGLPEGSLIGSVTSVVDYEGLDTLIRALEYLPEGTRVLIVGEGTARPELEKLAKMLGVEDRVLFPGRKPQQEIWKWYASLDVFVVPRKDTPVCRTVTPLKPLMAQALGVPVVASDLPALREVTGGLAEYTQAENPEALARAISRVGSAPEVGEWIRTRTWRHNGRRLFELYDSLHPKR
ncbi:GDP-mannose-dependent alpha-(1-6)-phosphatidylinositol monomannoside mannosyltransferase [Corynebacterium occultum]|uniref:GDP-mannose-dependent alpha-(1-6)-phosphatidylinositol monomannoside mannosyltransferase n=1 Tax=Corynebacterium occultum TaxID=2675219 RepID=A0A6B8W933_9CORY|nr:glycosyltransferase [Corynebacterium occultum]QGU08467.1 GDP-mannose-dependent alpha-(1-6)-phosphatidylinositol monomannoside mannosyltransferase [Corynebacterium occultum]